MAYIEQPQVLYRQHIDNKIGSQKRSEKMEDFWEIRNLFIEVKIDHFNTLLEKQEKFSSENLDKLSKVSYDYFESLKKVKKCSFRNTALFWRLYKYEKFGYSIQNYCILHMPALAQVLFHIRKGLKNKSYE